MRALPKGSFWWRVSDNTTWSFADQAEFVSKELVRLSAYTDTRAIVSYTELQWVEKHDA